MKPASNFSKRPNKTSGKSTQSGEIRIIGGNWRGRRLKVHNKEGLRPTTDRLKETLFNWLMMDIRGAQVLDCFAGAGSLGFEAASRGASHVTCIEKDKQAANQLKSNCQVLNANAQIRVLQGDFFAKSTNLNQEFDLIFVDPPFHKTFVSRVIPHLINNQLLANNALIYLEQESNGDFEMVDSDWSANFEELKDKKAGQVRAQLFRYIA